MTEEWREVPGWEGFYAVSSLGRVKRLAGSPRCWEDRIIKPIPVRGGYDTVCFTRPGNYRIRRTIHSLVAEAFIGPRPSPAHEINHLNGVKTDNTPSNLKWVTRSENIKHAFDTGLHPVLDGSSAGSAKLTDEQVLKIIDLHAKGMKIRELVDLFPVGDYGIRQIVEGRSHRKLPRPQNPNTLKGARRVNRETVIAIKTLLAKKELSSYKIAALCGVSPSCVHSIKHGRSWAHINP
jgi:hypothetical protein